MRALRAVQEESPFIFKLLTCAKRQPSEVKEAIAQEVKARGTLECKIWLNRCEGIEEMVPHPACSSSCNMNNTICHTFVRSHLVAAALKDNGGACEEFNKAIAAQFLLQENARRSDAQAEELARRARLLEAIKKDDK